MKPYQNLDLKCTEYCGHKDSYLGLSFYNLIEKDVLNNQEQKYFCVVNCENYYMLNDTRPMVELKNKTNYQCV